MEHQNQWKLAPMLTLLVGLCVLIVMFLSFSQTTGVAHAVQAMGATPAPNTQYFTSNTTTLANGQSVDKIIIKGPPHPPAGFEVQRAAALPATARMLTVPAFTWVFGCSAVSAAMIAGYYDRNGFPNLYTGPTNGGVMPLDNSSWGDWTDASGATYPNVPLAASHKGVDGRTMNGSIDDYWVGFGIGAPDPYITGGWPQHTWGDAIGDYMKTSQSAFGNPDGGTIFYTFTNFAGRLPCSYCTSPMIRVYRSRESQACCEPTPS